MRITCYMNEIVNAVLLLSAGHLWVHLGKTNFAATALCGTHCGFDTVTYRLFLWEEIVTNRSDSVVEKGSKLMDVKDFANCRGVWHHKVLQ